MRSISRFRSARSSPSSPRAPLSPKEPSSRSKYAPPAPCFPTYRQPAFATSVVKFLCLVRSAENPRHGLPKWSLICSVSMCEGRPGVLKYLSSLWRRVSFLCRSCLTGPSSLLTWAPGKTRWRLPISSVRSLVTTSFCVPQTPFSSNSRDLPLRAICLVHRSRWPSLIRRTSSDPLPEEVMLARGGSVADARFTPWVTAMFACCGR
jgi:hypothetical protein